jgi:Sulfatase
MRTIRPAGLVAVAFVVALAGCGISDGQARPGPVVAKRHQAHPPVVFISFDEFSTISLVDGRGSIDAARYPNYAALARDANWFPYATASSDETGRAMEALLTGSLPGRGRPPTYGANPRSLFTLLGRRYRVHAAEEVTSLCPRHLCPHVRRQTRHSVRHELGSGRPERFARWLRSIHSAPKPTLFFKHVLLPHGPWRYLPSGRHYARGETIPGWGHAFFSRWVSTQKYQRHLLQLGFADRLLGDALRRLREEGLYERALIVVTADNGESFGRIGNGHEVSSRNFGDIALTPLLIKAPFQHDGATIGRHVRTVDIVPTVASLTNMRIRWRPGGHSVYGRSARRIPASTTVFQRSGRRFTLTLGGLRRWADAARRRKVQLFGSGNTQPGLYGVGPYRALVGTPPSRWQVSSARGARVSLDGRRAFDSVRLSSSFIPSLVTGRVTTSGARPPRAVAVAVNGRIAGTSPTFRVRRGGRLYFSALLPESVFQDGRNDVRLFSVSGSGRELRLQALGS